MQHHVQPHRRKKHERDGTFPHRFCQGRRFLRRRRRRRRVHFHFFAMMFWDPPPSSFHVVVCSSSSSSSGSALLQHSFLSFFFFTTALLLLLLLLSSSSSSFSFSRRAPPHKSDDGGARHKSSRNFTKRSVKREINPKQFMYNLGYFSWGPQFFSHFFPPKGSENVLSATCTTARYLSYYPRTFFRRRRQFVVRQKDDRKIYIDLKRCR